MKHKIVRLAAPAFAVALALGIAVSPAGAYFTASDFASGSKVITWPSTKPEEHYGAGQKVMRFANNDESVPVYIRARISYATALGYDVDPVVDIAAAEGWVNYSKDEANGVEWWYYTGAVDPGDHTNDLTATISWPFRPNEDGNLVARADDQGGEVAGETTVSLTKANGTNFSVIVYYEAEPVPYDENGVAIPAADAVNSIWSEWN